MNFYSQNIHRTWYNFLLSPYFLGTLIGVIFFGLIESFETLDPTSLDYFAVSKNNCRDSYTYFLGWQFFRFEPWNFPIGAMKSYLYPEGTSIVFTDSIPILAFIFKLISPMLPDIFQYYGIWSLLCYILQGIFAALLLKKLTNNNFIVLLGATFFVLSPAMWFRDLWHLQPTTLHHSALKAHWLILAAWYLYFKEDNLKHRIKWIILLVLSVMIHLYLSFMVIGMWGIYILKVFHLKYKNSEESKFLILKENLGYVFVSIIIITLVMWQLGYFLIDTKFAEIGSFEIYSTNLNSLFNPTPLNDTLLPKLPMVWHQYEGFNYIGLGMILILVLAIYQIIKYRGFPSQKLDKYLILLCLLFSFFALSKRIYFNQYTLLHIGYRESTYFFTLLFLIPFYKELKRKKFFLYLLIGSLLSFLLTSSDFLFGIYMNILTSFRSNGRMFWVINYLLTLGSITVLIRFNSVKKVISILIFALIIQVIDLHSIFLPNTDVPSSKTSLKSHSWQKLGEHYKKLYLIPLLPRTNDHFLNLGLLATSNRMSLNYAFLARYDHKKRDSYYKKLSRNLRDGRLSEDTLYVFDKEHILNNNLLKTDSKIGILDNFLIIAPKFRKSIPDLQKIKNPFTLIDDPKLYSLNKVIQTFKKGYTILLVVKDPGNSDLPQDFQTSMFLKGSHLSKLDYRDSYAAIIDDGNLISEKTK